MSNRLWLIAGPLWAAAMGLALFAGPAAGLVVLVGPPLLALIFNSPLVRLWVVVLGGLLVFGSTGGVGPTKYAYFALLLVCSVLSALNLAYDPPRWTKHFRPLVPLGVLLVVALVLSVLSGPSVGITTTVRQGLFYLMIPIAPLVGLDAGRALRPRLMGTVLGLLGALAAVSYCIDWLGRRGISASSGEKLMASTFVMPAMIWALAVAFVTSVRPMRDRLFWLIPLLVIPIALILPGTRTNLVVFVAPIAMLGSRFRRRVAWSRLLVLVTVMLLCVVTFVPLAAKAFIADPAFLDTRIKMLLSVLEGGAGADESASLRLQQYQFAWEHIQTSPIFGLGPGYASDMILDTPLTVILRIGFFGTFVLLLFLAVVVQGCNKAARQAGGSEYATAARGIALVVACLVPFGTIIEDRGFAMTIMLMLAGLGASLGYGNPQRAAHVPTALDGIRSKKEIS